MGYDGFDLEELFLAVVAADDGEAEAAVRFDQGRANALALQLGRIPREEWPVVTCSFNRFNRKHKLNSPPASKYHIHFIVH